MAAATTAQVLSHGVTNRWKSFWSFRRPNRGLYGSKTRRAPLDPFPVDPPPTGRAASALYAPLCSRMAGGRKPAWTAMLERRRSGDAEAIARSTARRRKFVGSRALWPDFASGHEPGGN